MTMEPTPEQLLEWYEAATEMADAGNNLPFLLGKVFRLAYAAGADAELEACVEWIRGIGLISDLIPHLYAERRPKPPSLKQQALDALNKIDMPGDPALLDPIYAALESLPDD